jgi:hypothetical protein
MLDETFEPRYPIELAKAGEYFGSATFTTGVRSARPSGGLSSRRPRSIFGKPAARPKPYVLLCPMCQKEFRRESMRDTSLNAHQTHGVRSVRHAADSGSSAREMAYLSLDPRLRTLMR